MKFINLQSTDVYENVATDEYFLIHKPMEVFMLWINDNCIVLGKNQNSYKEINHQFVAENKIKVVRRLTGGGAVFHDLGNLNFTFISKSGSEDFLNFKKFLTPIVNVLNKLGVKATISGRNDMLINNKKFSGNAQYLHKGWLLHHGTIMFSVEMSKVMQALNVNPLKMQAKGINSIKSRVTNIAKYLPKKIDIGQFRELLAKAMFEEFPTMKEYHLTSQDKQAIQKLRDQKYATWEHNFGKNPEYDINHSAYLPNIGVIDIFLNVKNSIITSVKIFGDFFALQSLDHFEKLLVGLRYEAKTILEKLLTVDHFNDFFHNLSPEELTNIIIGDKN